MIFIVPTETVDISALEARSENWEDPMLNKAKQPMSEDEAAWLDKLEGAKVQKRKITRNGGKRKVAPRMQAQMNVLDLRPLYLLLKKLHQMTRIWDYSVRMRR